MAAEGLRVLSRGQSLLGPGTWLGGKGRPLLGPLEMQRFLLDILPSNPSCLCHKKRSLRVESGGTGVLPVSTQKGQPGVGTGGKANCSLSYLSTAPAPRIHLFCSHWLVAFSRIFPKPPKFPRMMCWLFHCGA